ncbi:MAG: hypothetical protein O2780_03315 [Proteobacteria bacterium]|jgi:hypothetical protein|nr:hypothetical protein [Pseudomonadota bacterium]MDA1299560.1 hypothetical protein [Pseudomonadota bacterium]
MADAYSLAREHLARATQEAADNNIDSNTFGQALIWEVITQYMANGRTREDIKSELEFTLENVNTDGIFHVVRN